MTEQQNERMVDMSVASEILKELRTEGASTRYLISYDVLQANRPSTAALYKKIHKVLNDLGAKQVLESQWAVRSKETADNLRHSLRHAVSDSEWKRISLLIIPFDPDLLVSNKVDIRAILRKM